MLRNRYRRIADSISRHARANSLKMRSGEHVELTAHQIEMLDGAAMFIGTVDRAGRPDVVRCFGAKVCDDRKTLRLLLPRPWADSVVANLRDGGWVAFSFTNPTSYESFQAKGKLLRIEPATDDDRTIAALHQRRFAENVISIGVHESARHYAHRAEIAIAFRIDELYCQTPGPGAGEPVGGTR